VLQDLEAANAFVVALDTSRSWFRYHHLFADLLQLELRRTEPDQVAALHRAAAGWFAGRGYPVEGVRHAQAARDWTLAARLLADNWPCLYLDGQTAVIHELRGGFPAEQLVADAELAALAAGDELARGSLADAERYLGLAERAPVPEGRQGQTHLLLGIDRLLLARQRGNRPAVAEEAQRLQDAADAPHTAQAGFGEELRALALISLGSTEFWAARFEEAERYLDQGIALARRIGRPYLEYTGLVYKASELFRSAALAAEQSRQAVELAEQHGWTEEPAAGLASLHVARLLVREGRPEEAEPWIQCAERTLRAESEPAVGLAIHSQRGLLELARGQDADALAAFQAADRLAGRLAEPSLMVLPNRSFLMQTLVRLGQTERAGQTLAALGDQDRDGGAMRTGLAVLHLAQDNPDAAIAALAPVLDGSALVPWPGWLAQALLLEAIARDAVGDETAAGRALERALDLAEPDGALFWFLLHSAPGLLERHARHGTSHAALIADILSLLAGRTLAPPAGPRPPLDALSGSELRVLRYLPTNLSGPEIAAELYVSHNTVRTHVTHLYEKLGVHTRAEAVARARALGLLAPSPLQVRAARPG
jgi:LuxR family maltose regulon positive regulatory protein